MRTHLTLTFIALLAVALAAPASELEAQRSTAAGVTVVVKPLNVGPGAKSWDFQVRLDTHSQDLSDDLVKSARLLSANGKQQVPLAWDGSGPGGHHREGVLRFAPISPAPEAIELRIERPGEPSARSFRWQLK